MRAHENKIKMDALTCSKACPNFYILSINKTVLYKLLDSKFSLSLLFLKLDKREGRRETSSPHIVLYHKGRSYDKGDDQILTNERE